ncbi:MAG: DEAD/DEAH box helicase [Myxococcales bacterium]|nr:DEAD/DEAH box helicase [Myxococcales bacterium]MCB9708093.1 DEAD/DEAH box helicase [Myxococcales bacterium]
MSEVEPSISFDVLPLRPELQQSLKRMGFVQPTPVQLQSYAPIVEGRDLIVQAQTGTGKTAAFGIPIIDRRISREHIPQALILAPTRELALQSANELGRIAEGTGIRTLAVYGGAGMQQQIDALRGGIQIVSGTPGRVLDHLVRGTLDMSALAILVLDEADEMLSMGFIQELQEIMTRLPKPRQTLLFSATVEGDVMRMSERYLSDPVLLSLSSDAVGAAGIRHFVYLVSGKNRVSDLNAILQGENPETALIFCNTKAQTEAVVKELRSTGINAEWLNGDLPQREREAVLDRTRTGKLRFLVATDVAARGIDISHITHVINYTFPESAEQYVHRTGRTGRAGRTGTAISLVAPTEIGSLYYLRLQYKIHPIERSLPTDREHKTRLEMERMRQVMGEPGMIGESDRGVARRILARPDAEEVVAGLVARIQQLPTAAEKPAAPAHASAAEPAGPTQASAASGPRSRSGSRRRKPPSESAASNLSDAGGRLLYVSLGRRDGFNADEIVRFVREKCGLEQGEVSQVRVRDFYSFMSVPPTVASRVIETLNGQQVGNKTVVVEAAKSL